MIEGLSPVATSAFCAAQAGVQCSTVQYSTDQQHAEVGPAQVQCEVLAAFLPARQLRHVGDVGLDVGAGVGVPAQAPVYLHDHPLL